MNGPTVFISYSHRDKRFLDELLAHMKPYVRSGSVSAWSDRQIAAGSKWLAEIEAALGMARVAILLVSPQFLASDFIHDHELGPLLKAAEAEGVKILWIQLRESSYKETPLRLYQAVVSPPAKPLAEMKAERDRAWVQLCEEVKKAFNGSPSSTGTGTGPAPLLDLGRLPIPGPNFVGRDAELARLDAAWENPSIHVLTLVAFGGVGKSALVARWMDRMAADNWRRAARVLDWSFYSQGMEDRVTSAEPFIDHALRFFGDPDPKAGSLHDRGTRLAPALPRTSPRLWRSPNAGRCACTSATRTSNGRASAGTRGISPRRGGMWCGRGSWWRRPGMAGGRGRWGGWRGCSGNSTPPTRCWTRPSRRWTPLTSREGETTGGTIWPC